MSKLLCLFGVLFLLAEGNSPANVTYTTRIENIDGLEITYTDEANGTTVVHIENFAHYLEVFNKSYADEERKCHEKAFTHSYEAVKNNQRDYASGTISYKLQLNEFADSCNKRSMSSEVVEQLLRLQKPALKPDSDENLNLPSYFDWRAMNVVSDPEYQGDCGSCWIFAAVSVTESANAIAGSPLISLSKQQVLDCMESFGCDGGNVMFAFQYIKENGLLLDRFYPYFAEKSKVCFKGYNRYRQWINSSGILPINSNDELIMHIIRKNGPVAVMINVDQKFRLYSSGVLTDAGERNLRNSDSNHYLVIVGWGSENNLTYWIAKNSWGSVWGERGYVRLKRGINSHGMNTFVAYALAKPSGDRPTVCEFNGTQCNLATRLVVNHSVFATLIILVVFIFQ